MKKRILLLLLLLPLLSLAQTPIDFYYLDGTPIEMPNKFNSTNSIFDFHFKKYEAKYTVRNSNYPLNLYDVNYEIVCQEYSMIPLFIVGVGDGPLFTTKKEKKKLKKVLRHFNKYYEAKINARNYDYIWGTYLDDDIKDGTQNTFFLKTLGIPDSTHIDSDGYMVYDYTSLVLTFRNGRLVSYSFRGRLY